MKKSSEILEAARELISEGGWCQNSFAKDAQGKDVELASSLATSWCALGSIAAVLNYNMHATPHNFQYETCLNHLTNAAIDLWGKEYYTISQINDGTVQVSDPPALAVWNMFTRAIERAKQFEKENPS